MAHADLSLSFFLYLSLWLRHRQHNVLTGPRDTYRWWREVGKHGRHHHHRSPVEEETRRCTGWSNGKREKQCGRFLSKWMYARQTSTLFLWTKNDVLVSWSFFCLIYLLKSMTGDIQVSLSLMACMMQVEKCSYESKLTSSLTTLAGLLLPGNSCLSRSRSGAENRAHLKWTQKKPMTKRSQPDSSLLTTRPYKGQ